ncbi:ABC transporter permease [Blastococcus sp. BMG 814]|uniref:ABC transporter permease n=1 Tax=Blastococcus carthaginiensis TaxID=3050034 RepID=A0ABT9IBL1_9ACTN|nr:ABC transporter permease [Blastococcus carthaginiensis]MDP5182961.1 ABC transporter permease [Blastococcus carthaginiensis]
MTAALTGHAGPATDATDEEPPRPRRWYTPYLLLLPGLAWLAVFFLVPMVALASMSLQTGSLGQGYRLTWEWSNYSEALSTFGAQFGRSFLYAGAATLLCLLIGYPLAYAIAFKAGRWRNLLLILVIAPFFTSFLIRTLAWKIILSDDGWVVDTLRAVALLDDGGRLLATPAAVVLGLTYNFLPFMVLPLYASLEKMDERLLEAAADLYANAFTAFRKVTWRLSLPGVVAGTLLTFIPAAGDYVNVQFLGTPNSAMVGTVIQSRFLTVLDYPTAAALSFALMVSVLVIVLVYVRRVGARDLL